MASTFEERRNFLERGGSTRIGVRPSPDEGEKPLPGRSKGISKTASSSSSVQTRSQKRAELLAQAKELEAKEILEEQEYAELLAQAKKDLQAQNRNPKEQFSVQSLREHVKQVFDAMAHLEDQDEIQPQARAQLQAQKDDLEERLRYAISAYNSRLNKIASRHQELHEELSALDSRQHELHLELPALDYRKEKYTKERLEFGRYLWKIEDSNDSEDDISSD